MLKKILMVVFSLFIFQSANIYAAPDSKLVPFWNDHEESSLMKIDHSVWGAILQRYVDNNHPSGINRFNYAAMSKGDKRSLENYLDYLQQLEPRQYNLKQQKAYWLNFYNAAVVNKIIDSYPLSSSRGLGWGARSFEVVFQKVSLNTIEHGILRPIFKDPRILFALNAGSLSSGNILKQPFTAANTEQLLDQIMIDYINHPRGALIENKRLRTSKIFQWYIDDFGGNKTAVRSYMRRYASEELKAKIDLTKGLSYDYDWTLNQP